MKPSILAAVVSVYMIASAGDSQAQTTDYIAVAEAIDDTMRAYHYNPAELDTVP